MTTKHKGKISYALHAISILPLFFSGIAVMLFGYHWITQIMYDEVNQELQSIARTTITLLDTAYPGDYELVTTAEGSYRLYKGEHDITTEYALVDQLKKDTGMDVSLFYQDTRVLTTIYASNGTRFIGTAAPDTVIKEVFLTGETHFYENTFINNQSYFSYYTPLYNSDGYVTGILFVGKPCNSVDEAVQNAVYPLVLLVFIAMLITIVILFFYTQRVAGALTHIRTFLTCVSGGDMLTTLEPTVLHRNDELGDIGRCAVSMQNSLRTMLEQDVLTGLFNRRSVGRKLEQIISKSLKNQTPFSVAIGDIDFFKKINDTYGHEAGDLVLKEVSSVLREHMVNCGFVARWGGEEFLLVFDRMDLLSTHNSLQLLLDKIRNLDCEYNGQTIKVTMTFGVASQQTEDVNLLFGQADKKLYTGKANGRNQIVI